MNHQFSESLARSHAAADWTGWEKIYRSAFPRFAAMIDHRDNGWWQAAGVDRQIVLNNTKSLFVDEKVRYKGYSDIALEIWSDEVRRKPGWIQKPLLADYIAYAILPRGICHLLPLEQLQSAWDRYGAQWIAEFGTIRAPNGPRGCPPDYFTISCCVPPGAICAALVDELTVLFPPEEQFHVP